MWLTGDSDGDACAASLSVSGVFWGTWPITHKPSSKAIITNEIVFFTIMAPKVSNLYLNTLCTAGVAQFQILLCATSVSFVSLWWPNGARITTELHYFSDKSR